MPEYVLEMEEIEKSFPGIQVLKRVNLKIEKGRVHALMGENGAGKSTLMKVLMGIYSADSGTIKMNGNVIVNKNPRDALEHGISMIHQELNPVLDQPVYENVYLGRELKTRMGTVDKKGMIEETNRLLESMGLDLHAEQYMRDLSTAQCQLIEIIKAISVNSQVIIMDEPTSAITDKEIDTLFQQIRNLKNSGAAIIYISHKMDEIFKICDHITVLRDGEYIGDDEADNLNSQKLIQMMVGRELKDVYPKVVTNIGEVIFEARNISHKSKVRSAGFQVRRGEILGIAGLVGAGRSELLETIFGARVKTSGTVIKNGKQLRITHPRHAIKNKIALLTEDRKFTGLNLKGTVKENTTLASLRERFSRGGIVKKPLERKETNRCIEELKIKTRDVNTIVNELSGGNQQKVIVAKWLLSEPDVVFLDEPTRGIDVGAKRDIYLLIGELVREGKAVVIVSSEIPELMGLCDRILVMAEGHMTGELKREDFSQEAILSCAARFGREGDDES